MRLMLETLLALLFIIYAMLMEHTRLSFFPIIRVRGYMTLIRDVILKPLCLDETDFVGKIGVEVS